MDNEEAKFLELIKGSELIGKIKWGKVVIAIKNGEPVMVSFTQDVKLTE